MRAQVVLLRADDDCILMARHERNGKWHWVLPGGSIEAGESPEEAAIREVREETGLSIELEELLFVDPPRQTGEISIRENRYTYLARVAGGELQSGSSEEIGRHDSRLEGIDWLPFDFPDFDEATRDTLALVQKALVSRMRGTPSDS